MANLASTGYIPTNLIYTAPINTNLLFASGVKVDIVLVVAAPEEPEEGPEPIPVPLVFGDVGYTDHAQEAIERLCQQFRSEDTT